MPAPAHKHQAVSIPPPIMQCEQKDFREYFHWNEVGFAGWQQRTVRVRVRVRGRFGVPDHDLTKATSRALGRWRESKSVQQQLAYTRAKKAHGLSDKCH